MLDLMHIPSATRGRVWVCNGNSAASGVGWTAWQRQRGETFAHMFLLANGGGGGTGVIGANSTAAGGGGGGSSGQSRIEIPLYGLPDQLWVSVPYPAAAASNAYISIAPNNTTNHLILHASGGGLGGNAAGATPGAAGAAGSLSNIATAPLGGMGNPVYLSGQAGLVGSANSTGAALTLPVTGILCTGGTGGAGLGAAASSGSAGGSFIVPAAPSPFPPQNGGAGSAVATTPPEPGREGLAGFTQGLRYFYGGTGGASTHGTATGGGLVQARGGNGVGPGCGGGGMGGALTGSTAAAASLGGPGICIIISW
jgi:hypothetical protein